MSDLASPNHGKSWNPRCFPRHKPSNLLGLGSFPFGGSKSRRVGLGAHVLPDGSQTAGGRLPELPGPRASGAAPGVAGGLGPWAPIGRFRFLGAGAVDRLVGVGVWLGFERETKGETSILGGPPRKKRHSDGLDLMLGITSKILFSCSSSSFVVIIIIIITIIIIIIIIIIYAFSQQLKALGSQPRQALGWSGAPLRKVSTRVPPGFHKGSTRFCKTCGVRALKEYRMLLGISPELIYFFAAGGSAAGLRLRVPAAAVPGPLLPALPDGARRAPQERSGRLVVSWWLEGRLRSWG